MASETGDQGENLVDENLDENNEVYLDLLEEKERQHEFMAMAGITPADLDEGIWDSMAVMASEQWNRGEADETDIGDLIPNGHAILSDSERGEVFLTAAQYGKRDLVEELFTTYGDILLQYTDNDRYTALHRASYNGHLPVVEYLLGVKADVNARTEDGWQPLHCACRWNKADVASLLLQNGAVINSRTNGGQTPLHLAASNDQAKATLELLLTSRDIDVTLRNEAGETAKSLALSYGRLGYLFEMKEECIDHRLAVKQ